jgi:transcriptional regulator with XRE-family HTH domain
LCSCIKVLIGERMAFPARTRLKSKRLWRDMTLQQVAELAGVKYGVVQEWEAGTHVPRADQAIKVAKVMGLDLEDLFHDFEIQRVPRETAKREEKTIA